MAMRSILGRSAPRNVLVYGASDSAALWAYMNTGDDAPDTKESVPSPQSATPAAATPEWLKASAYTRIRLREGSIKSLEIPVLGSLIGAASGDTPRLSQPSAASALSQAESEQPVRLRLGHITIVDSDAIRLQLFQMKYPALANLTMHLPYRCVWLLMRPSEPLSESIRWLTSVGCDDAIIAVTSSHKYQFQRRNTKLPEIC